MRLRFLLGLAAVLAIAVGSVIGALIVGANERDAFHRRQREEALRSAHQAESLAALSVGQLSSATAFYQAESHFNSHEFSILADSLLSSGALSATAFIQPVRRSDRPGFERSHDFQIVERAPLGMRRASSRPIYFPVTYLAAKHLDLTPPLGYDVGSDAVRGSFLRRARDTGNPTTTPVMHLLLGGVGVNVYRPVYRDGAPTATVAQRRAALTGFAAGAFHISDLATAASAVIPEGVDVQLVDHGRTVTGPSLARSDAAVARIQIADRGWLLVLLDPNRPGVSLPVLIAVFGISLAALLGALVLIWSRNERMQELRRQASQDPLTGLKNRRRFEEELRMALARSWREGGEGALLMLDLDSFKQVNDTLGHPAGDRVIAEIADVLRGRTRETDVLARLGGDEFAVALPRCDMEEAHAVAEEIRIAIREHMRRGGELPPITASIGIAPFGPSPQASFESVLAKADTAMYAAKDAGRDTVRSFGPAVRGAA